MKKIFICTILLLSLLSCNQQSDNEFKAKKIELTPEEYLSIAFDDEIELNEGETKAIINSFISSGDVRLYDNWYVNLSEVGNIGSASIFIGLEGLLKNRELQRGNKILLLVPKSARFSYGMALLTVV